MKGYRFEFHCQLNFSGIYLILTGCWTGRSQSVYSFMMVARISGWWYVYVFRTNSRRILVLLSASIPYWASSAVKEKYASERTTPTIRSYLQIHEFTILRTFKNKKDVPWNINKSSQSVKHFRAYKFPSRSIWKVSPRYEKFLF